jgi:hypothetical protein
VADSFVQYGVFCPLYWLLLSWGIGAVYVRAKTGNNPGWLFSYAGFICASHWLVSQSLAAAFVPVMFFEIAPLCFLVVFTFYPGGEKARKVRRRPVRQEVPQPAVQS